MERRSFFATIAALAPLGAWLKVKPAPAEITPLGSCSPQDLLREDVLAVVRSRDLDGDWCVAVYLHGGGGEHWFEVHIDHFPRGGPRGATTGFVVSLDHRFESKRDRDKKIFVWTIEAIKRATWVGLYEMSPPLVVVT